MRSEQLEQLYEKWDRAYAAQVELEAEMFNTMEAVDNCGEAERSVLKNVAHQINAARGAANKAWKEYDEALQAEHAAEEERLADLEQYFDELLP